MTLGRNCSLRVYRIFILYILFVEWMVYRGSEYLFSNDALNWTSAQSECERLAANLTSITSQQEQDFIDEQLNTT